MFIFTRLEEFKSAHGDIDESNPKLIGATGGQILQQRAKYEVQNMKMIVCLSDKIKLHTEGLASRTNENSLHIIRWLWFVNTLLTK